MRQPCEALHGSPDALVSVQRFWPISTWQHFQALCGGINDRQRGAHFVPEHSQKLDQTLTLIALFLRLKACSISLIFQPLLILKPKHQQQMCQQQLYQQQQYQLVQQQLYQQQLNQQQPQFFSHHKMLKLPYQQRKLKRILFSFL